MSIKGGEFIKQVYLDTCVWCRPFDDPSHQRILMESDAVIDILRMVDARDIEIIGSSVLLAEISMIASKIKEDAVLSLVKDVVASFETVTDAIEKLAIQIMQTCAIDSMDALHMAIAIENEVELFLTTDDIILNKAKCISKYNLIVKNPCEV
ncbi:MAG: PIN domain-containing protein [Methanosarcinales archaeon]|nr:PIN domain-containing protein [Methanosarcinales archaeon]